MSSCATRDKPQARLSVIRAQARREAHGCKCSELTISRYFAISSRKKRVNASSLISDSIAACSASRGFMSCGARMHVSSPCMRLLNAHDALADASTSHHCTATCPGSVPATAGCCGTKSERLALVTARARMHPLYVCGHTAGMLMMSICTSPPTAAVIAEAPLPRGKCIILT